MIIYNSTIKDGARGRNKNVHQSGIQIVSNGLNGHKRLVPVTGKGKSAEGCYLTVHAGHKFGVAAEICGINPKVLALVHAMQAYLPVGTHSPAVSHTVRMSGRLRVHSVQNLHADVVDTDSGNIYHLHIDNIIIL